MDERASPVPRQRLRETSTGRPVVDAAGAGTAAPTTIRIPPPRKRVRFSKWLAWRLFTRVLLAGALIAIALLVAAPERHTPCADCLFEYVTKTGALPVLPVGRGVKAQPNQVLFTRNGRIFRFTRPITSPQAFLFAGGSPSCQCSRETEVEEWFALARDFVFPTSAPAATTTPGPAPGPAFGGWQGGPGRR